MTYASKAASAAAVAAAAAIVAAGCGSTSSSSETTTTPPPAPPTTAATPPATTAATTTTAAPPTTTGACATPPGADTTRREGGHPSATQFLTAVSVTADGCLDRVTFTFRRDRAEEPGYSVEYRPRDVALVEDGSGKQLSEQGTAFLVVRLEPSMTADIANGDLVFTYKGPRRLRPEGTAHVQEVLKTGDFEGVVTWAIGLDAERPFSVSTSGSPPRLVVSIG